MTLRAPLENSLEKRYCFLLIVPCFLDARKHGKCHRIGQFPSQNGRVQTVSEGSRSNRRSLKELTLKEDTYFSFSHKAARGRPLRDWTEKEVQEHTVPHCFPSLPGGTSSGPTEKGFERELEELDRTGPGCPRGHPGHPSGTPYIGFSRNFSLQGIVPTIPHGMGS